MSIKELPRATSRLLRSSQVLTTPASLVKELLDNALDAKATSVDIVISANTLDKIEVRDNGHGISLEDLKVIGQRGYTSKLRTFGELKSLGGLNLGFRGEALASAVELGDVSITTRVEGEIVAISVKLSRHGGVDSQTSVSHPIGTTVCVTNLFSRLPVRKQTGLKDAKKSISRIKEILQSYALARLNVRLTLKVLKVVNANWSFAPRTNESTREIVSHVIGREAAAQCVEMISTFLLPPQVAGGVSSLGDGTSEDPKKHENPEAPLKTDFIIQALLPKPDADLTKISGAQYISIDSRPVSSMRGSPKKIISIYKAIVSAMLADVMLEKVKSPFLRLNIVCPAGSYDINVEPAKDVVLFENEDALLSLVEGWLRNVYGDRVLATAASKNRSKNQYETCSVAGSRNRNEPSINGDDASCSVKRGVDEDPSGVSHSGPGTAPDCVTMGRTRLPPSPQTPNALRTVDRPGSHFDMSEDYPDELELDKEEEASVFDQMIAEDTRNKQTSRNLNTLNPWVITKLNTSLFKRKTREPTLGDPARDSTGKWNSSTPLMLPTLRGSSISRPSLEIKNPEPPESRSYNGTEVPGYSQSSIEEWLQKNRELSRDNPIHPYDVPLPSPESSDRVRGSEKLESASIARDMSANLLRSPPSAQAHFAPRIPRNVNTLFVSPMKDAHLAVPSAADMRVKALPLCRPQSNVEVEMIFDRDAQGRLNGHEPRSEVHEALDFERRKEAATRKLREQLRRSQSNAKVPLTPGHEMTVLPSHKNRPHIAVASLEINRNQSSSGMLTDKMPSETCLPDDDPRAYLIRRQKSLSACPGNPGAGRKLKRTKTMLLPLETIPDTKELHGLCQVVTTNIGLVRKSLLSFASLDQYVESGKQAMGLLMSAGDIQAVEMKLATLVKRWVQITASEEIEIVLDLGELQGRSMAGA